MTTNAKPSPTFATILLVIAASGFGCLGFMFQSQVTSGTVEIGLAVLLAVFARINQAGHQHREQWQWHQDRLAETAASDLPSAGAPTEVER